MPGSDLGRLQWQDMLYQLGSRFRRHQGGEILGTGMIVLISLNGLVSLITVGFGVAVALNPLLVTRGTDSTAGEYFYAREYAARAVQLGLLARVLPFFPQ